MALINNNYVLVTDESIDRSVDITSHPAEQGLPLSDTVQIQPTVISISGKIADTSKATADIIIGKLKTLQKNGSLITYVGKAGTFNNMQIQSFNTNYNNKNNGGADFDMLLNEIRIAKKAYVRTKKPIVEEKKETTKLKVGDIVLFTGGYVWVSSDANVPSAARQRQRCKLTKISTLANRKHIYHLENIWCNVPKDKVFGWVDASDVKYLGRTQNQTSTNGGTQQVKRDSTTNRRK